VLLIYSEWLDGQTREEAIATMKNALDLYVIRGVKNNVNFLREIMMNPRFQSGDYSTAFIPQVFLFLF
jgi:biotin carboxylase